MINVVIIDDHELIRIATASLLEQQADISVIGDAATGEEGLELIKTLKPHIVITDISMPGIDGIEVTRKIKKSHKKVHVIVLSRFDNSPYPEKVLAAGASGYINKGASPDSITEAIYKVMAGEKYMSPDVAANLIFGHVDGTKQIDTVRDNPFEKLTKREFQIVKYLIDGIRPNDIADLLDISVKTVFTHRSRLHNKLGTKNDVELTKLANKYNL
ncbi:response regulator [Ostreibacterium oceani]|uniref:Response regulator n=1 Tax=Ostreibacterium oceani TaxID=2654998 RepID=A0A6N7EZK6_9GAMM|nr:response regulator transcription factor [Ostreibacterium oceani]MPV86955.1 response regulator [Ostreibacterium oceani]